MSHSETTQPRFDGAWRSTRILNPALIALSATSLAACSTGDATKSWNELATCLAGSAANADLPKRVEAVRLTQLGPDSATAGAQAWPARCASYANDLYVALSGSRETAILKRRLSEKLGCSDDKKTCAFTNDPSLVSITTELWESAKSAGLTTTGAPDIKAPTPAKAPLLSAASWKGFTDSKLAYSPKVMPDNRVAILIKAPSGRVRPSVCELPADLQSMRCFEANKAMPEVPTQTVKWVRSAKGFFVSSLNETGLIAYNLENGEQAEAHGMGDDLVQSGVAVEEKAEGEGFVAMRVEDGKAQKPVELKIEGKERPIALGEHLMWLEGAERKALVISMLEGQKLKERARLEGSFSGPMHVCQNLDGTAVGTWGRHEGQHGAKPTAAGGKTEVTIALLKGEKWAGPFSVAIPFERTVESELICTPAGASLVWARPAGDGTEITRLDCTESGCKPTSVKTKIQSQWWWAATAVGDKVAAVWRGAFGETRARVATIDELADAQDTLLFDATDYGGPTAGEATVLVTPRGVLLLFKGDTPAALRIGADGSAGLVTPN